MPVAPFFVEKSSKLCFFGIKIVKIMIFCAKVVNMTTWIGHKWAHKQLILIFAAYFEGPGSPEDSKRSNTPAAIGVWEGVGGG